MDYDRNVKVKTDSTIASQLKLTLNAMATLLAEGDVRGLASYFECPLPVYIDNKFILFQSREKVAEALAVFTIEAARNKVKRIEPSVVEIEDFTAYRSLFVARWDFLLADGTCLYSNVVRYVGRRGELDGLLRIELLEYLKTGAPDTAAQLLDIVET